MTVDPTAALRSLASDWRGDAELLRRRGAPQQANALESAAEDLEERLREWGAELLTLEGAAEEAGLAYDTIQRKVSSGEIPNAGEQGSPRVRRADLHPWMEPPGSRLHDGPVDELADKALSSRG